jgi:hypothetical protein
MEETMAALRTLSSKITVEMEEMTAALRALSESYRLWDEALLAQMGPFQRRRVRARRLWLRTKWAIQRRLT